MRDYTTQTDTLFNRVFSFLRNDATFQQIALAYAHSIKQKIKGGLQNV